MDSNAERRRRARKHSINPVWLCLNGHEWAKRQASKRGLDFQALENGFRTTEDAQALAEITSSLNERHIERFFRRWEARLPAPFTARIELACWSGE